MNKRTKKHRNSKRLAQLVGYITLLTIGIVLYVMIAVVRQAP